MLSMERHQYILRYLEENGNSTRKELAKLLNPEFVSSKIKI